MTTLSKPSSTAPTRAAHCSARVRSPTAVGVSRTPVREALLRLETEGLLRLYPKRGALVLPVSPQEISDVLETRELVETFTAGRADIGPGLVEELSQRLTAMREHASTGDAREFAYADRCFHRTLVAAAGNEILTQLYDSLRDRQLRMARLTASDPVRTADAIRDHTEILEAVRSGDRRNASAPRSTGTCRPPERPSTATPDPPPALVPTPWSSHALVLPRPGPPMPSSPRPRGSAIHGAALPKGEK